MIAKNIPSPISDRRELENLPVGLYSIPCEQKVVPEWFDIVSFTKYEDCPVLPIVNIVDKVPLGLTYGMGIGISCRKDGLFILFGWGVDKEWEVAYWKGKLTEARLETQLAEAMIELRA